ncbi:MAG TPA: PH domain-containing protein [Candidatus Saccharimonadales bacterium]|nr:PH domain-containing protein [Candidatus Saccharimonadales bacterium]
MVNLKEVDRQLKNIGYSFHFFWRAERRELCNVLTPGEMIQHCANGQYEGGLALLCVTDQRILLIDRKPLYLTLEDVRFDMVTEVDYRHRLLNAAIHVTTPNRTLVFIGWNHTVLRNLMNYTQRRIMELRQQYMLQQFQPAEPTSAAPSIIGRQALSDSFVYGPKPAAATPAEGMGALPLRSPNPYTSVPLLMRHRISKF